MGMRLHIPQQLTRFTGATLAGEQDLSGVLVEDADFSSTDLNAVSIEAAMLLRVSLETSKLKHFNLTDVYAEDCLMFGSDLDGSGWLRVEVKGGNFSGLIVSDASFEEVVFSNCKLNMANFRFSKLKSVTFVNCNLQEADFYAAHLSQARFEKCNLTGAHFGDAALSKVDLRTSNLTGLKGVMGLKGALVDTAQLISLAAVIAAEVGIETEE